MNDLFFKRPLIIIDNISLAENILQINQELSIQQYFNYGISPFSDKNKFLEILKDVLVLDLRTENDIDCIIKNFDLVISIHCKQIFPKKLVASVKCINLHPGYNPYNRGWYPQVFAIINNEKIGATIHEIDIHLDHGGIIDRKLVKNYTFDTSCSLYQRIIMAELELWKTNVFKILINKYSSMKPEFEGELKLKSDFNNLCKLDLETVGKYKDFYNLLRALTFLDYKNAYFVDSESGKKVYLRLIIQPNED